MRDRGIVATLFVMLASVALLTAQEASEPPRPAAAIEQPEVARPSFAEWLDGIRAEALTRGIRQGVIDEALADVEEPLSVVLERDRRQAETVLPLETYLALRLKPAVVRTGREMLASHKVLLDDVAAKYGVPGPIVVAIWGIESNFGRFSGVRPTVAALATLAWDPRRATLFRSELFDALEILNRGDIEFKTMRGSWAGAMGQTQFMPSSYLKYAEDFDGDGRPNIWTSPPDVFASIANYLKGHGWTPGVQWGREVKIPPDAAGRIASNVARRAGTCQATRDMTVNQTLEEWGALGVTATSGRALPATDDSSALVSGTKRHFLVSANYDALLSYNCSHAYAISVALLADRIAARDELARPRKRAIAAARPEGR